jgi:hypothetical protein
VRFDERLLLNRAKEITIAVCLAFFSLSLILGFFLVGYHFVYGSWPG